MRAGIWIRLLMVVLACTASRKNFPVLVQGAAAGSAPTSHIARPLSGTKYEAVIPSRRHHETRRVDWVKQLAAPSVVSRLERTQLVIAGPKREQISPGTLREPRYLIAFLNSTAQESIPPPYLSSRGAGSQWGCGTLSERT